MRELKALVLMQLKDKLDFGFAKTKKTLIRKIVLTVLKFVVVAAAAFVLRYFLGIFMFYNSDTPKIMIVLVTFLLGISCITCTVGLVKSLYFAEDNKVLITMPAENNVIFLSKLIVYYFYELSKEYFLVVPVLLGVGMNSLNILTFWFIPWMLFVFLFVPAVPVLIGALLSIPALYIARFAGRYPVFKVVLFVVVAGALVWALAVIIGMLPENIDLINQGGTVLRNIKNFLLTFERTVVPASLLVYLITGQRRADLTYNVFAGRTFLIFAGLLAVTAVLIGIVFLVSRPLFFGMMSKSFEFEKKSVDREKLNRKHGRMFAFLYKEFKLCIINEEVSLPFVAVYVAVPLLIFLLNKLYFAMDTRLKGQIMTYAFNLLIMLLPMLAGNAVIATLFSKEGRAGYVKKTKPIDIMMPIFAKLFFFMALSVPSIAATAAVFGSFVHEVFRWYDIALLGMMLLLFQYGHIMFSALLDIMRPQNEQYATVGDNVQNPNETVSTIAAFVISALTAGFGYVLFSEVTLSTGTVTLAMLKLFGIAAVFFVAVTVLFVRCIRAYYYEK
ncbi:MAG: hypothetical protein J6Z34_02740 [Clostridia bacterium]|nr:hypothetical protein [Clostridia bacterium]